MYEPEPHNLASFDRASASVTTPVDIRRPQLEILIEQREDTASIAAFGILDEAGEDQIEEAVERIKRASARQLIIDLRGVTSVRSEIDDVFSAWGSSRRNGLELILVRVPKHLRSLIEEAGLGDVLPVAYGSLIPPPRS